MHVYSLHTIISIKLSSNLKVIMLVITYQLDIPLLILIFYKYKLYIVEYPKFPHGT